MQRRIAIQLVALSDLPAGAAAQNHSNTCDAPVYLTFDTGHMGIANLVAETRNPFSPEDENVRQGLARAATLGLDEERLAAVLVESAEERQALIDLFRIA